MRFICEDHDLPLTWSFSSYFAIEPFLVLPAFSFLFYFTFLSFSFALLFSIFFFCFCLSVHISDPSTPHLSLFRSLVHSLHFLLSLILSLSPFILSLSLPHLPFPSLPLFYPKHRHPSSVFHRSQYSSPLSTHSLSTLCLFPRPSPRRLATVPVLPRGRGSSSGILLNGRLACHLVITLSLVIIVMEL